MPRKAIPLKTKLASALLGLGHIPYDHAKLMTDDQIISLYHFDHGIPYADGGPNEPWNLTPRLIPQHREKTAKIDVPRIAKGKRIRAKQARHQAIMAGLPEPETQKKRPRHRWASRPFNRGKRPDRPQPLVPKILPRR